MEQVLPDTTYWNLVLGFSNFHNQDNSQTIKNSVLVSLLFSLQQNWGTREQNRFFPEARGGG
jgi:hypothetical protein